MTKYQKRHRIIATFFLLIFFPTLLPNNLFASNNGPKSPEAASFEPVDATDMVNLITGQYSYVLPLLNVPSPEGGYPLALSYHAGIALDQEASWTGLGWNVNPGAIDRGVNGYPDDYSASHLNEYFYDSGGSESASFVSTGWSSGAYSVGVGFNWGSNQALGGFVSMGAGLQLGGGIGVGVNTTASTSGSSVGVGASYGYLSVGASVSSNKGSEAHAGFSFNSNGLGMNVGYSTSGAATFSIGTGSLGYSLTTSKSGNHSTVTVAGVGISTSFNNTVSMGDYTSNSSSWIVPISVPTPYGIFSLSFGSQSFTYWLAKNKNNYATGPLYFQNGVQNVTKPVKVRCCCHPVGQYGQECSYVWNTVLVGTAFMDINEIPIDDGNSLATTTNVVNNNFATPNYDNYNIQAQGLSGSMSAPIFENGALIGLTGNENDKAYSLKYSNTNTTDQTKFEGKPNFYLENEISTYINVQPGVFNTTITNSDILNYYNSGSVDLSPKPRKKTSTFIEYYTNNEIINNSIVLKQNGFLQSNTSGFNRDFMPKDGIGAFKITAIDGKTYHYSLPVYNHEIITRTSGTVADRQDESQSYMEKRQLEPFATHWLLTAVTGPDYIDNGDGIAGDGDLGYWTSFEYGKWTDAFIWKGPYKKDYYLNDNNSQIKTWVRGRKQLYYLDNIKTRTHTALFIKSKRTDALSENWVYNSVNHIDGSSGAYTNRFSVPSQNQLRLDKIILIKNQDNTVDKTSGTDLNQNVTVGYPDSDKIGDIAEYNISDNILDSNDNWQSCISKAIKVIDFTYDYSLVPGDNRLTLKSVDFKGKSGTSAIPPYKFDYINDTNTFNIDNKDGWGYLTKAPETFSLNKITTPQGAIINIIYESNKYKTLTPIKLKFSNESQGLFTASTPFQDGNVKKVILDIGNNINYPLQLNQIVNIKFSSLSWCKNTDVYGYTETHRYEYNDLGHITATPSSMGVGKYEVTLNNNLTNKLVSERYVNNVNCATGSTTPRLDGKINVSLLIDNLDLVLTEGGPRVSSLKISDGINNYFTDYKYGENEDGVGHTSYVPYSQNIIEEVPYSAELPAPRVMYEYVTMSTHGENTTAASKIRYKFNVMKDKTPNQIKYGDFYEISKTINTHTNTTADKDVSVGSFTVKDNLVSIGQLLEIVTFNAKGHQLSKISNNYYKTTDVIPNNMGVTQESYQTYKTIDYKDNTNIKDKWVINSSTRIKYPNIIKSSTEQKNGYTYTTEFLDYDLISGISKEQVHTSSDGKSFKTKIIPAYLKYSEMGSKVDNINNKNMLAQTAANYSYIWDKADNKWKETGVGITTWSNIWTYKDIAGTSVNVPASASSDQKIWRKHKSYVWNGIKDVNGIFTNYNTTTGSGDDNFDWTIGVGQPSQWKQTSEVTLYDHYSTPLEMKDINGNLASTKMGDNDTKVMATGNAGYNEMFFAGAENLTPNTTWLEPEVTMTNASRNSTYFHTGKWSVAATSSSQFGVNMKDLEHRLGGKYKVSVWVEKTNAAKAVIKVNGTPVSFQTDVILAGNWQLKTAYITVPTGVCSVYLNSADSSTVYFDDLMIRPVASSITGYVYNEWDELTHIIGNNGLATRFEYDAAGRLIRTYSEVIDDVANGIVGGFKIAKSNTYNNKYM